MSPSTKPLPEEKLLEHLRSRDRASSAAPVAPVPIPGFTVPVHGSAGRVRRAQWSRAVRQLGFGFLIGIVVVELGGLAWVLLRPAGLVVPPEVPAVREAAVVAWPAAPGLASLRRELFVPKQAPKAANTQARQLAAELTTRLTLLGIVDGEPPQAIIEDTSTRQTHFVSLGATVGGAVLERVANDFIVLDLSGEKIQLAL